MNVVANAEVEREAVGRLPVILQIRAIDLHGNVRVGRQVVRVQRRPGGSIVDVVERILRKCPAAQRRTGNVDAQRDPCDAALVAVDDERRNQRVADVDAARSQIANGLLFNRRQRDAGHSPHAWQPRRELHACVHGPFIVAADHDQTIAASERRRDGRNQTLARFEDSDVDDAGVDELFDEPILATDENRRGDCRRLFDLVVADDDRQRQCGRVVSETRREVRGRLDVGQRRRRRHGDARRDAVGKAVAVGVAGESVSADERGQRRRPASVSADRGMDGRRKTRQRGRGREEQQARLHGPGLYRGPKRAAPHAPASVRRGPFRCGAGLQMWRGPFRQPYKQKGIAELRCPSAPSVWLPQHSRRPAVIRPTMCSIEGQVACPSDFFGK